MVRLLLVLTVLLSLTLCTTPACSTCSQSHAGGVGVETRAATNIMSVGTTLNGRVTDMGDYSTVEVWFRWWSKSDDTVRDTPMQTMTSTGDFSAQAFPLTIGETYYFNARARGQGENRESIGGDLSFYVP